MPIQFMSFFTNIEDRLGILIEVLKQMACVPAFHTFGALILKASKRIQSYREIEGQKSTFTSEIGQVGVIQPLNMSKSHWSIVQDNSFI